LQTVYLYDAVTGEYRGDYDAQESALEPGVFITPTCSTSIEPPAYTTNQVAVFSAGAWSIQSDHRGQTIYDQATCATEEVTAIGALPDGYALTAPAPTAAQQWKTYQASAQAALDATDTTVHRVIEAVALGKTTLTAADVVIYMEYRASLRAILSEAQPETIPTALPAKPAYPANT